jgi:hypothetical protein
MPKKQRALAGEPFGTAAEQCFKFVVEDEKISGKSDLYISGTGANTCVYLSSASPSDGEAVFIVCCKKKKVGEKEVCKDCRADINLVVVPDPTHPSDPKIVKEAVIICKTQPPAE